MKKITIQSDNFYVSVPHEKGEALFEFSTQEHQNNFIQEIKSRGELAYALTPLQIKLEVHKKLSLKYKGGIVYLIIKKLEKELDFKNNILSQTKVLFTIKSLLTELSPYLTNHHSSSEDLNLQIHLNEQLPLSAKWLLSMTDKNDKGIHFTNYLHRVCNLTVDHTLTPPQKQ